MGRSFGIDVVRTLGILIVMLRHYQFLPGFNYGVYAIEFLFVVSGYLIGQILLSNLYSTENVSFFSVKRFMIRRWFRILPLYYLAILIKFIFFPAVGINILYYIFFLQNHFYGIDFFPETWSLVIDEWFYLGTPLILYFFMRFVSAKKNYILIYLTLIVVLINLLRAFWIYKTNVPFAGLGGNIVLHQDTLLMGVILAFIKYQLPNVFNLLNSKLIFAFAWVLIIIHTIILKEIRYPIDRIDSYYFLKVTEFTLFAILIASTLPYIENSVKAFKQSVLMPLNKIVTIGSKLSYALYLFHSMSHMLAAYILSSITDNFIVIGLLGFFISIISSHLLYQYVEKKFLIIRDRYYPDQLPNNKNGKQ
jgi:peptidoglycan/LPS O-acetylase OafA/YrhL